MQRSFGTQISGNRRPGAELSEAAKARIIATLEAGVSKPEIAVDNRVNRLTVYDKLRPPELGYPTVTDLISAVVRLTTEKKHERVG